MKWCTQSPFHLGDARSQLDLGLALPFLWSGLTCGVILLEVLDGQPAVCELQEVLPVLECRYCDDCERGQLALAIFSCLCESGNDT